MSFEKRMFCLFRDEFNMVHDSHALDFSNEIAELLLDEKCETRGGK